MKTKVFTTDDPTEMESLINTWTKGKDLEVLGTNMVEFAGVIVYVLTFQPNEPIED